jgi:hypothetical protein
MSHERGQRTPGKDAAAASSPSKKKTEYMTGVMPPGINTEYFCSLSFLAVDLWRSCRAHSVPRPRTYQSAREEPLVQDSNRNVRDAQGWDCWKVCWVINVCSYRSFAQRLRFQVHWRSHSGRACQARGVGGGIRCERKIAKGFGVVVVKGFGEIQSDVASFCRIRNSFLKDCVRLIRPCGYRFRTALVFSRSGSSCASTACGSTAFRCLDTYTVHITAL